MRGAAVATCSPLAERRVQGPRAHARPGRGRRGGRRSWARSHLDLGALVKVELEELAEAGAVVVAHGLGAPERLGDRLRLGHALLENGGRVRDIAQVLKDEARRLRLARSRLARDDERLVLIRRDQRAVRGRRHREDVRRLLLECHAPLVLREMRVRVARHRLIRVDGHEHGAVLRVHQILSVPRLERIHDDLVIDGRKLCEIIHGLRHSNSCLSADVAGVRGARGPASGDEKGRVSDV